MRRKDENCMKRIMSLMTAEVTGTGIPRRSRDPRRSMGRHDITRPEVSQIEERRYW